MQVTDKRTAAFRAQSFIPKRRRGGRRKGERHVFVLGTEDLFKLFECCDVATLLAKLASIGVYRHVSGGAVIHRVGSTRMLIIWRFISQQLASGRLRIITPMQSVMDRLQRPSTERIFNQGTRRSSLPLVKRSIGMN